MKKLITLFLALILVVGLIPASVLGVSADDAYSGTCGENAVWSFDPDNGTLTISGVGAVIGQPYSYSYPWFDFSDSVRVIEICDGITEIGSCAFQQLENLTAVSLPNSLRVIGSDAFWHCGKLTVLELPEGLESIGANAFNGIGLRAITIPASLTGIEGSPFSNCESLEQITVAKDNPRYSSDAAGVLYNKQKTALLRCPQRYSGSFTIPNTVEIIQNRAFYKCTDLLTVTLSGSVSVLDVYCFEGCTAMTSVSLPEGLLEIRYGAFADCESIWQFQFPASLQSLNSAAFGGCSSVERYLVDAGNSVYCSDEAGVLYSKDHTRLILFPAQYAGSYTVPEGVVELAWFGMCENLEELVLPASFVDPQSFANRFMGCMNLRRIAAAPENPVFSEYHGAIYNKAQTELICCPIGMEGSYTVAPSCKTICSNGFNGCAKLAEVILPAGLETIDIDAFFDCVSMKSIRIPASVTSISGGSIGFYFRGMKDLRGGGGAKIRGFAIYGYHDTAAQTYADQFGFDFYDLDVWEEGKTEFDDVSPSAWYAQAVHWAVGRGIVAGTGNGLFSPKKTCTRAEIITMLWRAMGSPEPETVEPPFEDVKPSAWYAKAVCWAVEAGITSGTSETTFSPKQVCTRAQAVTFLWKAVVRYDSSVIPTASFQDVDPNAWYARAVAWAVWYGITAGTSETTFSPTQPCTRAQVVTFFWAVKEGYSSSFGRP